MEHDKPAPVDGRNLRRQHSRQRLVEAMIALVREGVREPTADQVAERAGLAMRTVFRHFRDMDGLYREIARTMQARARALLDADVAGATWQESVHKLVDKRARLYDELLPMRLAAGALRHRSPFLQEDHEEFVRRGRRSLQELLPAELVADRPRLEALDALLSYETWIRLRSDQRLSPALARQTVHLAVDALLAGHAAAP